MGAKNYQPYRDSVTMDIVFEQLKDTHKSNSHQPLSLISDNQ